MEQGSKDIMSRSDILDLLRKEVPNIKKQYGIKKIGLFGSFARDDADPLSDIDLLVSFEDGKERFRPFMNCIFYLEELFGRKVELIAEHSLDKRIQPDIEHEVIWV